MAKKLIINGYVLELQRYAYEKVDGLHEIAVEFEVTSEEYHEIATLLYENIFTIEVPSESLVFTGNIQQYATSYTNLYEADQVAVYSLTLREIRGEGR